MLVKLSGIDVKLDAKDFKALRESNWRQITPQPAQPHLIYLVRNVYKGKTRTVEYLHKAVLANMLSELPAEIQTHMANRMAVFLNGDTLDCTRANLRLVEPKLSAVVTDKGRRTP